jgi:hypothetical protein
LALMALLVTCAQSGAATSSVRVLKVPMSGVLPSAVTDERGVLHLVFATKQNIFYSQSSDAGATFSTPVRVNEREGFAQVGLFRGPQIAVDAHQGIHVVWYNRAWELDLPQSDWGVMYSRRIGAGAFERTRNLSGGGADGMSVAASGTGVFVVWHAGEALRLARSEDAGATFSQPQEIGGLPCECCGTGVEVAQGGAVYVAYRDRTGNNRDMYLRAAAFDGTPERKLKLDRESWNIEACPMSNVGLGHLGNRAFVAWEHRGAVLLSSVDLDKWVATDPIPVSGRGKFPFLLAGERGVLVGWKEGRRLRWRIYDPSTLVQQEEGAASSPASDRSGGVVTHSGEFLLFP